MACSLLNIVKRRNFMIKTMLVLISLFAVLFQQVAMAQDKVKADFDIRSSFTEELYSANKVELNSLRNLRRRGLLRSKIFALKEALKMNLSVADDPGMKKLLMDIINTDDKKVYTIQAAWDRHTMKKDPDGDEKYEDLIEIYRLFDVLLIHTIEMGRAINELEYLKLPQDERCEPIQLFPDFISVPLYKSHLALEKKSRRKKGLKRLKELTEALKKYPE